MAKGFSEAMDVFTEGVDPRLETYRTGNENAQQTIVSALPQIQNALLGRPVDFASFQSRSVNPNTNYLTGRSIEVPTTLEKQNNLVAPTVDFNPFRPGTNRFIPAAWERR